jgi:hypothetical protein
MLAMSVVVVKRHFSDSVDRMEQAMELGAEWFEVRSAIV